MNYLQWNKEIWDYFFLAELRGSEKPIVLAVTTEVIKLIGSKNKIDDPIADFIKAINTGPIEKDANNSDKFSSSGKKTDFLTKAKRYLTEPKYSTNSKGRDVLIPRWPIENYNECLITAYLAFLVLMIGDSDDDKYWGTVNQYLVYHTDGTSQGYVPELFLHLEEEWSAKKGFNFFQKNIYTRKKNVGTIYSQLPLTEGEEKNIIASLYLIKKEDKLYFDQLKNDWTNDLIEEFFVEQRTFLNQPTVKGLSDNSSELANVIKNYFFKNFNNYLNKVDNLGQEDISALEKILEGRKNEVLKFEPKYFVGIKNGKFCGVISINLKTNNLLKKGTLTFKNGNTVYSYNTRHGININGDDGHSYLLCLSELVFDPGEYKIFNSDLNTQFKITVRKDQSINNLLKSPIWFKAFSKQEPDNLKIITTEKTICFDINNPHKIITKEKIEEKGFNLIGDYNLLIGDDGSSNMIYSFNPVKNQGDLKIYDRNIEIINSDIEIAIKGAPDGIQGRTSFLKNIPIKIIFNPTVINKIELTSSENLVKSYQEFNLKENIDQTSLELIEKLDVGDYALKVYDLGNIQITNKSFTISDQRERDNREKNEIDFFVSDFYPLNHDLSKIYSKNIEEKCEYIFSSNFMELLLDILIKGRKLGDIYNQDFKYIFNSLVEENEPEFFENINCQRLDLLEISKKVIYILDSLNIIERESHYINKIIRPYWTKSSINRRYNLIGALKQEEIERLERIDSVKSQSQFVFRIVNGVKIGIQLPRIFYVEKCEENAIPNPWTLRNPDLRYEFGIPEKEIQTLPLEGSLILKVIDSNINYSIPVVNCACFNWFTLEFENTTHDKLNQNFEYLGFKLIRLVEKKRYNNREIFHYYLFDIHDNGKRYQYFPYHQRDQAIRLFLRKVQYFDLSSLMLKSDKASKESLYNHITEQSKTTPIHREIIESRNENEIKKIINCLDIFHLSSYNLRFNSIIKGYFIFDDSSNFFGINERILLPNILEKYLIGLSGLLPIYQLFSVETPNDNLDEISCGIYFKTKEINFIMYFNVPEKIAFLISNSLIKNSVVEVAGSTAKPYNKINS